MRVTAAAGFISFLMVLPALGQSTGPADGGVQRNDQSVRSEPAPPAARDAQPSREPQAKPPARADEFDPPPSGCQFRGNKLDLLV
jgi:hypothetical protein